MTTVPRYRWQPTTAEIAARAGIDPPQVERFDQNTSPMSTSWAKPVVARSAGRLNAYPAANYLDLRKAAAAVVDVEPDRVVPGAGADELILLAARAFLGPGKRTVLPIPTYSLYEIAARQVGAEVVSVPAKPPTFDLPDGRITEAARDASLIWICAPSNPIGNQISLESIEAVAVAADGVVVVDAAYAEFSGDRWVPLVERHDNVLVLHTLSKAYGLAGARVGYAVGQPHLIDAIDAIRPPGSIGTLSVDLAVAALADQERMRATVETISAELERLASRLAGLGFRVLPSVTNFVLCEVGPSAQALSRSLMAEGLVVRSFAGDSPLADYLRITVRSPEADDRLVAAIERRLEEGL